MFEVRKKGGSQALKVYAVASGRFLTYVEGEDPHWEWLELNEYEPVPVTATELFRLHDELVRRYEMFSSRSGVLPEGYEPPDLMPNRLRARMWGTWDSDGVIPKEALVTILRGEAEQGAKDP